MVRDRVDRDGWIEPGVVQTVKHARARWRSARSGKHLVVTEPLPTELLQPADAAGMLTALRAVDERWADAFAHADALAEADLHLSVNGEWSFVSTLRHLVFAIDKWFTVPILGGEFHPIGLPNRG